MIGCSRTVFLPAVSRGLLLIIFGCFAAPGFSAEPTTGPLAGTTAAHNAIRQALNNGQPPTPGANPQPVACPAIPDLVWSDVVATSAQAWADGCALGHEGAGNPYGENLSLAGTGFGLTGPTSAVSWADEVRAPGFNYATNECPIGSPSFPNCGHYTQVAWASTTEVGCGFATCGGTEWLVCRYNPGGNVNVQTTRPYCTATQTTGCNPGPGVCGGGGNQLLTVTKPGNGAGTVTSNPAGINCGGTCASNFPDNTQVQLTAAADGGSNFVSWGGDCLFAGANLTCTITMNAAKNVSATFNNGGGNACTGATDLVCGVAANGTTAGATNDFDNYSCQQFLQNGIDVVYKVVPPQGGNVTVDLTPNGADLDLFVLGTCDTTNCTGGSENGGTAAEQVVFAATGGQTYYVTVEDWRSAGAPFTLTATCPGGGCTAPDGQDQNLANETVNDTRTVHVCGTITTGAAYQIGATGNVTLIAPQGMVVGNGLSVLNNATLTFRHN